MFVPTFNLHSPVECLIPHLVAVMRSNQPSYCIALPLLSAGKEFPIMGKILPIFVNGTTDQDFS
jgi:hypothetical protein